MALTQAQYVKRAADRRLKAADVAKLHKAYNLIRSMRSRLMSGDQFYLSRVNDTDAKLSAVECALLAVLFSRNVQEVK